MTSTTLDTAVEQVTAQARQVRFARFLVTLIAGFFYLAGRLAGCLWFGAVFCALMVRQGWRESAGAQRGPSEPGPSA